MAVAYCVLCPHRIRTLSFVGDVQLLAGVDLSRRRRPLQRSAHAIHNKRPDIARK